MESLSHLCPSIVPKTLLTEADPYIFNPTLSVVDTDKGNCIFISITGFSGSHYNTVVATAPPTDLEVPFSKESRRPDNSGAMMSNSLLTYAYIRGKHHPHACTNF